MPVIINDLEVILEKPDNQGAGDAASGTAPQAPEGGTSSSALTPMTLESIERHRRERAARVRAH